MLDWFFIKHNLFLLFLNLCICLTSIVEMPELNTISCFCHSFPPSFKFLWASALTQKVQASYLHLWRNDRFANIPVAILSSFSLCIFLWILFSICSPLSLLMFGFISFYCQPCSWNNYIFPDSKTLLPLKSLCNYFCISFQASCIPLQATCHYLPIYQNICLI